MPGPAATAIARLERELAKLDRKRAEVIRAIEALQPAAEREELTAWNQSATTDDMHTVERQRHARGARGDAKTRKLREAALAAGYTLRSLAEKLDTSQAQLSRAAQGTRPMDRALAERVNEAIGYAATAANWPRLRSE